MTLPNERLRAISNTREFLRSLLDRQKTPRVPLEIRRQAYWCLKHYPGDYDLSPSVMVTAFHGDGIERTKVKKAKKKK